ncbi:selenium metabolism membrane protein YedE/FdhT [Uliginosibacterium sp. 31-16]|uniref:selenium metabolism membrane protein YedE/FdhT n=1 Tax=Uliginosibacterium sp. 31-16 TaxID=3068315 RepID=UPI00273F1AD6|nr:selenium metabolism membrane protein YedE/FdhT [Uliginosibacterium sp. 31-16]MDP5239737.1 selenium metabolism membrane protein YedE/FdhT [Uliginosibacterium sp. 31-16]
MQGLPRMTWQEFKQNYLVRFWAPLPAVLAAGVLSAYYFGITGTFWAVTGEFTRWGGHLLQFAGLHPENWGYFKTIGLAGTPLDRIDGMMILGMFAGCLSAALWANNVKLRLPQHRIRIVQAVAGGMIAGFGARLAMGCNLAAFFTGIPQFSLHAWFFALATAAGSWFGARFTMLPVFRIPVKLQKVSAAQPLTQYPDHAARRFRYGMWVFVAFALWALAQTFNAPKLGLAALFGLAFGLIIERAQVCFTSAFRDLWLTGRTQMAKAIIIGMAVSTIGVYSYVQLGVPAKIMWMGPNAAIGGLLFGFGIVLAGGCETGWMYRAVEGQVHYWWVGFGNIIGATVLAAVWDDIAPALATSYPKTNLLEVFGPQGGLIVTYLLLAAAMLAVLAWEKRFFARKAARDNAAQEAA